MTPRDVGTPGWDRYLEARTGSDEELRNRLQKTRNNVSQKIDSAATIRHSAFPLTHSHHLKITIEIDFLEFPQYSDHQKSVAPTCNSTGTQLFPWFFNNAETRAPSLIWDAISPKIFQCQFLPV